VSSTLALDLIWRRLNRPFNLVHAVPALTGFPAAHVADLVTLHLAVSSEAEALLAGTPRMLRTLASSTTTEIGGSRGDIRGPIQWAETLNARANSFGAEDVFVCATPRRDHDVSENRALVAALGQIARAGRVLSSESVVHFEPEQLDRIAANAATARSLLRSPRLAGVSRGQFGTRELHKITIGRRSEQYREAIRMLQRRIEPLRGAELHQLCDHKTIAQHHALVLVMAALQRRGFAVPHFRAVSGELTAGLLCYRNWRHATSSGNHGILVNQVLVDAPDGLTPGSRTQTLNDLERRAGDRPFCLVASSEDAEMAVDIALEASSWSRSPAPA